MSSYKREAPIQHAEVYAGTGSTGEVRVACFCSIGRDHSHEDWVEAGEPATGSDRAWGNW